jgi:hypothetical protein
MIPFVSTTYQETLASQPAILLHGPLDSAARVVESDQCPPALLYAFVRVISTYPVLSLPTKMTSLTSMHIQIKIV